MNALMHREQIELIVPFMTFLSSLGVDAVHVGDPGVIYLLQKYGIQLPFIYDAQTLVTSAKHINFWVRKGAAGAVLARELTLRNCKRYGGR